MLAAAFTALVNDYLTKERIEAMAMKSQEAHRRVNCTPNFAGLRPASEAASRAKRANRKRDTRPELLLRSALWALGLRYRTHVSGLPGTPDLLFKRAGVVVFCDGDFWHGRNWPELRGQLERRHNADYWVAKIARNRERDCKHTERLTQEGWFVLRLWESDIVRDVGAAAAHVKATVEGRLNHGGSKAWKRPPV
jgi:DNA mismatch endonuclease, patch repair protein